MNFNLIACVACALLVACNNNAQETKVAETPKQQPEIASNAQTSQASEDGITGYWKLKLEAYDDNGIRFLTRLSEKREFKIVTCIVSMQTEAARSRKFIKAATK